MDKLNAYNWETEVKPLLSSLPARTAEIIKLRHKGWPQSEIGSLLGITQEGVSWLLTKAYDRVQFLLQRPKYKPQELRALLSKALTRGDATLMVHLWNNPSITGAIGVSGLSTQSKVRHRFNKCLCLLSTSIETHPELKPVYDHYCWVHSRKLYSILTDVPYNRPNKEGV